MSVCSVANEDSGFSPSSEHLNACSSLDRTRSDSKLSQAQLGSDGCIVEDPDSSGSNASQSPNESSSPDGGFRSSSGDSLSSSQESMLLLAQQRQKISLITSNGETSSDGGFRKNSCPVRSSQLKLSPVIRRRMAKFDQNSTTDPAASAPLALAEEVLLENRASSVESDLSLDRNGVQESEFGPEVRRVLRPAREAEPILQPSTEIPASATNTSTNSSPPNTPRKLSERFLKYRMKLPKPPPLKLMKKKLSCPSLTTYNNFFTNGGSPIAKHPPANAAVENTAENSTNVNGHWIRNNIEKPLICREDPGPSRVGGMDSPLLEGNGRSDSSVALSSASNASKSESSPTFPLAAHSGVRYKLVKEGPIQVCRLDHPRTVIGKLSSSKLLRRWENHHLIFKEEYLTSATPTGFMERPMFYSEIEDVQNMPHFDSTDRFCLRVFVPEGSLLLQTNHNYSRNQWLTSLQWRRNILRYRRVLELTDRPEVVLKEIKSLVELTKNCSLDDSVYLDPVVLVCGVLDQIYNDKMPRTLLDPVISCVSPLLETVPAVAEICPWFTKYCKECPRSRLVDEVFTNVAHQTLKKNMDFGKYPSARGFVQQFLLAVSEKNNGLQRIRAFIDTAHGPSSLCPHPRILPNLVSASLAAVHSVFDAENAVNPCSPSMSPPGGIPPRFSSSDLHCGIKLKEDEALSPDNQQKLECFCVVFETLIDFEDWRLSLSSILQPLPFPESTFSCRTFARYFHRIVKRLGTDPRCEVHLQVLGVRDGKEGWFHLFCPGGPLCCDDGELFALLLDRLIHCCCKRKSFLTSITCMLGPLQLLALRENETAMEVLCYMLEMETVQGEDLKLQMITALQSTSEGKRQYANLCDRQSALRELQQKGGPRKLTLPSKSTDGDLAVLLSSGSFGNLEWLSLAFTNVTSHCAEYLIKLPALRYLNLWSTQFGDAGVQQISEHLPRLQVLNLCETPATDKGLINLVGLKNLRKLNLNSTQLSPKTFNTIKEKLPALQEVDIRYTEAWCADEYMP